MKTKDIIAEWVLIFFVLGHFLKASYEFSDVLLLHYAVSIILWNLGVTLVVAVSGLFLIVRFVQMLDDLKYYEAKERQQERIASNS